MEHNVSSNFQMMQIDLSIDSASLCIIRALNTICFDDLHKIICHKLSLSSSITYVFFLPKTNITLRRVTRSFDQSSQARVAAYAQSGDTIYYRILGKEFHVRFSSLGVVDDKTMIAAKLLVTQEKIKNMVKKENFTYRNQMSKVTLNDLYKKSDRLLALRIFEYFHNKSFLMIHIGDMVQPIYVENLPGQFMMYFFQDEESYQRFCCVLKDTLPSQNINKYKQAIALCFSKKELPGILSHKTHNVYTTFIDLQRGFEMDGITEGKGIELQTILPVLESTIQMMNNYHMVFKEKEDALHIYYFLQSKTCDLKVIPLEVLPIPMIPYTQEQNILSLKQKIKSVYSFEMDYRFIKQPYKGNEQERLAYLLDVSALGEKIKFHRKRLFEKEQDIKNVFLDMLLDILEEHGCPSMIKVKDRYVYSIIYDLCHRLHIFVQIDPKLLYIEAYYEENDRVIYDMKLKRAPLEDKKRTVQEQSLHPQYSRKRFKMKGYFN